MPWLLLAAALVLSFLELRRADRRARPLRLGALALVLLGFGLLLGEREPRPAAERLTILAPGAPAGPVGGYRLLETEAAAPGALSTLGALGDSLTAAGAITLRGWGLLPHEWSLVPDVPVSFIAEPLPYGVVALEAPLAIGLGEPLVLRGRVHLPPGESGWIRLRRDTVVVDSAWVPESADTFALRDRPRAPGSAEYVLALRAEGVERREVVGVAVVERPLPRVLVLEGSPSFETGFLKRWLGGRGGRLSIRTQVARDRFRSEQVNDPRPGPGPALAPLGPVTLGGFDLIIADGPALAGAGNRERQLLRQAIEEEGAGLLVVPEVRPALEALAGLLPGLALGGRGADPFRVTRPRWPEQGRRPPVGVSVEAGGLVAPGAEVLIEDETGAALAIRRRAGRGAVGLTLVAAPSRWMLDGDRDLYTGYWSQLLPALARDTTTRIGLRSEGPPRPGRPLTVELVTGDTLPALAIRPAHGAAVPVPLERDPLDPRRWSGSYWAREPGWHLAIAGAGQSTLPFRVAAPADWPGLDATARLDATRFRLGGGAPAPAPRPAPAESPALPGFLLILLGTSALWHEHRRRT